MSRIRLLVTGLAAFASAQCAHRAASAAPLSDEDEMMAAALHATLLVLPGERCVAVMRPDGTTRDPSPTLLARATRTLPGESALAFPTRGPVRPMSECGPAPFGEAPDAPVEPHKDGDCADVRVDVTVARPVTRGTDRGSASWVAVRVDCGFLCGMDRSFSVEHGPRGWEAHALLDDEPGGRGFPRPQEFLAAGWGQSLEALEKQFPRVTHSSPDAWCQSDDAMETCFHFIQGHLEWVETVFLKSTHALPLFQRSLGDAREVGTSLGTVSHVWTTKRWQVTVIEKREGAHTYFETVPTFTKRIRWEPYRPNPSLLTAEEAKRSAEERAERPAESPFVDVDGGVKADLPPEPVFFRSEH